MSLELNSILRERAREQGRRSCVECSSYGRMRHLLPVNSNSCSDATQGHLGTPSSILTHKEGRLAFRHIWRKLTFQIVTNLEKLHHAQPSGGSMGVHDGSIGVHRGVHRGSKEGPRINLFSKRFNANEDRKSAGLYARIASVRQTFRWHLCE